MKSFSFLSKFQLTNFNLKQNARLKLKKKQVAVFTCKNIIMQKEHILNTFYIKIFIRNEANYVYIVFIQLKTQKTYHIYLSKEQHKQ